MLERSVTKFEKAGDERLIAEYPLRASARELHDLFRTDDDDPRMVLVYRVRRAHKAYLEAKLGIGLDLRAYDYFVEASDVSAPPPKRPAMNGASSTRRHKAGARRTARRSRVSSPA